MDYILGFFNYIKDLGATTMMPIIICIMGLILGAGFGKSLRAGLTVGIGFIGLNLVTGLMGNSLGAAVQSMVSRFGLSLSVIDVGWPSAAAIAFASTVGMLIIPVCLLVNIVMLLTKTTQTVDVDIWDYWHFAFTGALVAVLTGNQVYGIVAAILNMVIVMVLGDWTAKGVEETLELPGVSLPHGFTAAYVPVALVLNKAMDKIPGVNKINFDLTKAQKKFGVFGEPILIGTILGLIIGVLAGYGIAPTPASATYAGDMGILALGINLGAVLVLIPKMAALLMEGLLPISDAASAFIEKKFSNSGKIYIGLDSAVGVGHPLTLSVSLILVPLTVFLAVILPGNKVMPFADLAVLPWMFVLITPIVKGNGFRALIIGLVTVASGLYIATNLSPLITQAAVLANYDMGSAAAISSICDGANPLTWAIVRLNGITPLIGIIAVGAIALVMALINRRKILKEAAAMRAENTKVDAE